MPDKSAIKELEARVRQLLDDHSRLTELCAELAAQRDGLKAENRTLQQRVSELKNEIARLQLIEGFAESSRNRDKARARVNRLMREVDRCITLLELSELTQAPAGGQSER